MILLGTVVPPMAALLISDYLLLPKLGFEEIMTIIKFHTAYSFH